MSLYAGDMAAGKGDTLGIVIAMRKLKFRNNCLFYLCWPTHA
jgi:hypothetical protein